jgi:hypothetical protein
MTLTEIISAVRYKLYELNSAGTPAADFFTDTHITANINAELRVLPSKNVYLEEIHTSPKVVDQVNYALPTGTIKVEKVEQNLGTATDEDWDEIKGWDTYDGGLYLSFKPKDTKDLRIHVKMKFTELSVGSTESDFPEQKIDLLILGAAMKCYQDLMGYLLDAKNWDTIAKPDGITMRDVRAWYNDLKTEYVDLLRTTRVSPRPRDIDLVFND